MSTTPTEVFITLDRAATRLGVPAAWLRREALAGRVPSLRAGRRILLNIDDAKQSLLKRADETHGGSTDG